ncbi:MAG: M20/M25/M40 family metallo-hydrolase [Anaerolineae bacterium]|nr:M20/M25/M40 family metallo-hydrolase [Anaerolineae bacterium]MDQ7033967.1 M20/M25/M40 family metallo-hydrolase [Anaerolineae bacterium]
MQLSDLSQWVESQHTVVESALKELVEINTFTRNTIGVDKGMDTVSKLAQSFGFTVEVINQRHRLIKAGNGKGRPRILLLCHMDTVFPPDSAFQKYEPLGDGFVQGPGVGDIKGGLIIGLWSMLALRELCDDFDVQMVISADEEIGSQSIQDWYLGGHIGADYAIGLEPGFPQGELTADVDLGVVYQRRGYGAIYYTVTGKACHSGTAHLGVNAIEAAAQRIIRLHQLNDWENGISVTCGLVNGGISPNTVSGEVKGSVSWRFETQADGERIKREIEKILTDTYQYNPDLDLHDSIDYHVDTLLQPMERNEANQNLIHLVLEESKRLKQNVVPIARGGGSDANHTSAAGTPSICGMGAPAQGIHTEQEKIYLPGLFNRIELLISVLYRAVTGALETHS